MLPCQSHPYVCMPASEQNSKGADPLRLSAAKPPSRFALSIFPYKFAKCHAAGPCELPAVKLGAPTSSAQSAAKLREQGLQLSVIATSANHKEKPAKALKCSFTKSAPARGELETSIQFGQRVRLKLSGGESRQFASFL